MAKLGNTIVHGDNLAYLRSMESESVDLIYIDPPFNTGKSQTKRSIDVIRDEVNGDRTGFGGHRYRTIKNGSSSYGDEFKDFRGFMEPRLREAHRILKPDGSFFLHMDQREVHYCKIWLDKIFGRESFINEIIWAYDYGGKSKKKWSAKHDTILWYAEDPDNYTFNVEAIDRVPYMAPDLVGPEKAERGKLPTDAWWHTIVSPTGKEKTGYPTQKPLGILNRIVRVHSEPGDLLLDFFAGSGTLGEAAARNGREFILVDSNQAAIDVMKERLAFATPRVAKPAMASTRQNATQRDLEELDGSRSRVSVLVVGASKYEHLGDLPGALEDLNTVRRILAKEGGGIYEDTRVQTMTDPSLDDVRRRITEYAQGRSAKGDILVFYFSGHGCLLQGNEFGFCLRDAQFTEEGSPVPLSVLRLTDVILTLNQADVYPVFILDACASGAATPKNVPSTVADVVGSRSDLSYGVLCSCREDSVAMETDSGGIFTQALSKLATEGRADAQGMKRPYLTLRDLTKPVQGHVGIQGQSLPRIHVGADLPEIPLLKNPAFRPRTERFLAAYRTLILKMWNGGNPRAMSTDQISKISKSAYGNHSKLSLDPWGLLQGNRTGRSLTSRGKRFAKGELKIPLDIEQDPATSKWSAVAGTPRVSVNDL